MRDRARSLIFVLLVGLPSCAPVVVGPDPDFVWWTDNEGIG